MFEFPEASSLAQPSPCVCPQRAAIWGVSTLESAVQVLACTAVVRVCCGDGTCKKRCASRQLRYLPREPRNCVDHWPDACGWQSEGSSMHSIACLLCLYPLFL